MIEISNLFLVTILTSLTGLIFWLIWLPTCKFLDSKGMVKTIYHLLLIIISLFILPIVYLSSMIKYRDLDGTIVGKIFLKTPLIDAVFQWLGLIWVIGIVVSMIYYMRSFSKMRYIKKYRHVCESSVYKIYQETRSVLNITKDIQVYQSVYVDTPFVTGIFWTQIYLPEKFIEEEKLRIILLHELTHCKHKDVLIKCCVLIIVCIHWFNIASHFILRHFLDWSETYCDYEVNEQLNYPKDYFLVALEIAAVNSNIHFPYITSQLCNNGLEIERRIDRMERCRKLAKPKKWIAVMVSGIFITLSSMTSMAASQQFENIYTELYNFSEVENIEAKNEQNGELTEFIDDGEVSNIIDGDEEDSIISRSVSVCGINWSVPADTLKRTSKFYMAKDTSISIGIQISPSKKYAKIGIIDSHGTKRCVYGTGLVSHTFAITSAGYYQFYITNENTTAITAAGSYIKNT